MCMHDLCCKVLDKQLYYLQNLIRFIYLSKSALISFSNFGKLHFIYCIYSLSYYNRAALNFKHFEIKFTFYFLNHYLFGCLKSVPLSLKGHDSSVPQCLLMNELKSIQHIRVDIRFLISGSRASWALDRQPEQMYCRGNFSLMHLFPNCCEAK